MKIYDVVIPGEILIAMSVKETSTFHPFCGEVVALKSTEQGAKIEQRLIDCSPNLETHAGG